MNKILSPKIITKIESGFVTNFVQANEVFADALNNITKLVLCKDYIISYKTNYYGKDYNVEHIVCIESSPLIRSSKSQPISESLDFIFGTKIWHPHKNHYSTYGYLIYGLGEAGGYILETENHNNFIQFVENKLDMPIDEFTYGNMYYSDGQ